MNKPPTLTVVPASGRRPMTRLETGMFVHCQMLKEKPQPVRAAELAQAVLALEVFRPEKFETFFEGQVLLKRLQLTDALYDPCMVAFAMIMTDRAGVSVLWAWTLFERGRELGHPYTIEDFTNDFPDGPPSSDGALVVWDAQKCSKGDKLRSILGPFDTDNLLDTEEPWKATEEADAQA